MERKDKERELEEVLASRPFSGSERTEPGGKQYRASRQSSAFLKYLVTETLEGRPVTDEIATQDFFRRKPQTVAQGQSIARVNLRILRKKLEEYYLTEGIEDPIRIAIPLGTFVPTFSDNEAPPDKDLARGLYQINLEAPENIARALAHFEDAIRKNDKNAEAHAGKAMALCTLTLHDLAASPAELLPQAEVEARWALELNPYSWRAHAALGGIHVFRREWAQADEEFRRALDINPEGVFDHGAYGPYLLGRGEYRRAQDLARRNEQEHPADMTFLKRSALFLYAMRDYAEAERILKDLFALDEALWHAHTLAALICLETSRPEKALAHMRESAARKDPDLWPGLYVLCLERNGLHDEAHQRFAELREKSALGYIEPLQLVLGHMAFGEHSLAIEWLSRATDTGNIHMLWLHLWPFLDPLRENPEFKNLLQRTGLPCPPVP